MKNRLYTVTLLIFITVFFPLGLKAIDFAIKGVSVSAPRPSEVNDFCNLITNDLKPSGVNTLLLIMGYNYKFESYPAVASDSALSKSQVKQIVAACRSANIKLVPLMNLFSWQSNRGGPHGLLRTFPEFDETPWIEYGSTAVYTHAYCPNHPNVHNVVFSLIDEIIAAFECTTFSPGIDELMYIGEDERCKSTGKSKAQIFADEVNKLNAHVRSRGCDMWIWGDRLLKSTDWNMTEWEASAVESTWDAIDLLNKNITILDWHYTKLHLSPVHFVLKGFNVISCPSSTPDVSVDYLRNLARFSKSSQNVAMKNKFNGFIATHWGGCSYFMNEFILERKGLSTNPKTTAKSFFHMMKELDKITAEENAQIEIKSKSIYVSELGNDNNNNGSIGLPFKTLNRAVNVSNSGDTIYINGRIECSNLLLTNNINLTIIGSDKNNSFLQPAASKEASDNRVLKIVNTGTISLKNLTVRWGNATNSIDSKFGGNIYIENSIVKLENVNIVEGVAHRGGGLYINGTRNQSGAIHHFKNTKISDNTSTQGGGGGIFITSNKWNENRTTIEQCLISNNQAILENTLGGGIYLEPYVIDEFTFSGMLCDLIVKNSTIYNNSATNGGGIATGYKNIVSNITLINNTIAYNKGKAMTNTGVGPGGISNRLTSRITITLVNNLICMNTGSKWGELTPSIYDATLSGITLKQADHNIFTNNSMESALQSAQKPPVGNQFKDNSFILLEGNLSDNGGANLTLKFSNANSIAINAGIYNASIIFDQRGFKRDSKPDVGAFEYNAVTSSNQINMNQLLRFSTQDRTLILSESGVFDIYMFDVTGRKVFEFKNHNSEKLKLPHISDSTSVYLITAYNKSTKDKAELKILL